MKKVISLVSAALLTLALAVPATAADFANGSFETGPNPGSFVEIPAGGSIGAWDVVTAVDYIGSYWKHDAGQRSVDMNASPSRGVIKQAFDTPVNANVVVEFALSGNPNCGTGVNKVLNVQVGGKNQDFTFSVPAGMTNSTMVWEDQMVNFVAGSSSATLRFASKTDGKCGPAIDNVRITQTVATANQCKKGGWESMVDKNSTPFKNQGDCVSYYATGERNLAAG